MASIKGNFDYKAIKYRLMLVNYRDSRFASEIKDKEPDIFDGIENLDRVQLKSRVEKIKEITSQISRRDINPITSAISIRKLFTIAIDKIAKDEVKGQLFALLNNDKLIGYLELSIDSCADPWFNIILRTLEIFVETIESNENKEIKIGVGESSNSN